MSIFLFADISRKGEGMLGDYFQRRTERRRELRSRLVDTLLATLAKEDSLVVTDDFISLMGVTRSAFFRLVYSLVIQERMHMMADADGDIVLMTNERFHRFMLRRSGIRETEIRRRSDTPAVRQTFSEQATPSVEEETVVIDTIAAEAGRLSENLDWFSLEVDTPSSGQEKVPLGRQSLPKRPREPWPSEELAADNADR